MRSRYRPIVALAAAAAIVLTACGGGSGKDKAAKAVPSSPSQSEQAAPAPAGGPAAGVGRFDTGPGGVVPHEDRLRDGDHCDAGQGRQRRGRGKPVVAGWSGEVRQCHPPDPRPRSTRAGC